MGLDRKIRWIADALTILREPMDWERIRQLAGWAQMSFRLPMRWSCCGRGFGRRFRRICPNA